MMASRYASACYGVLLRVYPTEYRRRFASDMRETFLTDLARVQTRGIAAVTAFWIVTIAQAFWFGSAERRGPAGVLPPPGGPKRRFTWTPWADIRHALRLVLRSPVFAATSVTSLACGLAAATVIFSLADTLLLQTSPGLTAPDRIVEVGRATDGDGHDNFSYPLFVHLRDHGKTLQSLAATTFEPTPLSLADGASSERIFGQPVSASFFSVLGMQPSAGRFFLADEDARPGDGAVVVLTHRFWRDRFAADLGIVGRTLRLNNTPFQVIGVAAPDFEGPTFVGTDVFMPMSMIGVARGLDPAMLLSSPRAVWMTAIGRLADGSSVDASRAELNALLNAYREQTPDVPASWGMSVESYSRVPPVIRMPLTVFVAVLFALTGGLLAVACSNVAGMLMARATARRREIATRMAIGASRGQIVTQLVTETVVLFVLAILVAAPLTFWLLAGLRSFLPVLPLPIDLDLTLNVRSVLFTSLVALTTGLVFGLIPARTVLRADLAAALYGQTATATRDRVRTRHALVVAQVALSLTMVITAGLFVRTLLAASSIDPGFNTDRIDVLSLDTTLARVDEAASAPMIGRIVERVKVLPGVEAVAHARMIPLQGGGFSLGRLRLPGADEQTSARLSDTDWDVVSPEYFSTIGLAIVEGRAFTGDDRDGQPRVAIINESLARTAFPGESAIGRQIWQSDIDDTGTPLRIVGVARDAKYRTVAESQRRFIYVPFAQQPQSNVNLYVKFAPGRRAPQDVRHTIRDVEPGLPVISVQSFDEAASIGLVPQRVAAWVAGGVGVLGVLLAALGLYGLMSFLVEQRTREIAVRMALGASSGQMRLMVLRQALRLGAFGAVLGVVTAAGIGTIVENLSLLIDVQATDPLTFAGLSLVMVIVLFLAGDYPARRAARTSPAVILKAE